MPALGRSLAYEHAGGALAFGAQGTLAHLKTTADSTGSGYIVAFCVRLYTRMTSWALNFRAVMVSTLASKEANTAPVAA